MRSGVALLAWTVLFATATAVPAPAQQTPWVTTELRAAQDNQPRDALWLRAEYGRFIHSNATLAGHAIGAMWRAEGGGESAGDRAMASTHATAELGATVTVSAGRVGAVLSGSGLLGAPGGGLPVLAHGRVRAGLGADISVRVGLARDRYTATLASLDTLVIGRTLEVALDRAGAPGWAGELVARREWYGDGNPVSTAFGWVLAPLARGEGYAVRAGYAAAWQDSEQSNWVPDPKSTPRDPPGAPPVTGSAEVSGRYDPYFTPHDARTHSVLANAALALGGGWLALDGSYGVRATERAPVLSRGGAGAVTLAFFERSFHPYRAAAGWTVPLGARTSLGLRAEQSRTAYYRETTVSVSLAWSLPSG